MILLLALFWILCGTVAGRATVTFFVTLNFWLLIAYLIRFLFLVREELGR